MNSTYYSKAREVFSEYQAMGAGELPANPLSNLQIRLFRWGNQFKGLEGTIACTLGQGEELGELVESVTGSLDEETSFTPEKASVWERNLLSGQKGAADDTVDAIADILVYATQMCTNLRLDFGVLLQAGEALETELVKKGVHDPASKDLASIGWSLLGLTAAVGRIHHATLKNKQKIRGYDDEVKYRTEVADSTVHVGRFCTRICKALGLNVYEEYIRISEKVMKRDWTKNAVTGGQV